MRSSQRKKDVRKRFTKFFTPLVAGIVAVVFLLSFQACDVQSPMQPEIENSGDTLSKLRLFNNNDYPQYDSVFLRLLNLLGEYEGGLLEVRNGSSFEILKGSLTPPPLIKRLLRGVLVTMRVDLIEHQGSNSRELIYTFGPSGSKFSPPARAWFDWTDLGTPDAKVYYIDKNTGQYIELQPIKKDYKNQRMLVEIHHFSRYAVAWSR